jgi:hypothetical protein
MIATTKPKEPSMFRNTRRILSIFLGASLLFGMALVLLEPLPAPAQFGPYPVPKIKRPGDEEPVRLPNGKLQKDVILKHEHQKNLEALKEIRKLSDELIEEIEEQTEFVFSVETLKKMEQLEKLSKQVKSRFKKH